MIEYKLIEYIAGIGMILMGIGICGFGIGLALEFYGKETDNA